MPSISQVVTTDETVTVDMERDKPERLAFLMFQRLAAGWVPVKAQVTFRRTQVVAPVLRVLRRKGR